MSDQAPPEIQQGDTGAGPGGPQALPYGEATALNTDLSQAQDAVPTEAVPTEQPTPEGQAAEQPPGEAGSVGAPPPEENFAPGMGTTGLSPDDEKYLFSPTERPNEAPQTMRMIPPQDIQEWLPDISAEAARPDAPPQLKAIFKAAVLGPEG
jgi:hypothetical protein